MKYSIAGICKKESNFFIAKRKSGGALGCKWEFPGGKIEKNESQQQALIREYNEEFSVNIKVLNHIGVVEFNKNGKRFMLSAYFIEFLGHEMYLKEHTETRWVAYNELFNLDFADSDKLLFPLLK